MPMNSFIRFFFPGAKGKLIIRLLFKITSSTINFGISSHCRLFHAQLLVIILHFSITQLVC